MWRLAVLLVLARLLPGAGTAADIARAIRENSFDRDECYRVRDLKIVKEDVRIFLTDGYLIFSKPVTGKRVAAVFTSDVEGGDGEVILLPPDRAERSALARFIESPNLDEHFSAALFLFTGDEYAALKAQMPENPANKKVPEMGPVLDGEWTPALRNLASSYETRLTLDLIGGPGRKPGLFAALFNGRKLSNFDVIFDPENPEQVMAGQVTPRGNRLFFDTWTSFPARSSRKNPLASVPNLVLSDYRVEATVDPDLSMSAVTRVKVKPKVDGMLAAGFDIAPAITVSEATVDGRPAEVLQRESLRLNLTRGGNSLFLVVPPEPLRAGREYEFTFKEAGRVIFDAGDRVLYVSARGNWYPTHGVSFAAFDLSFRYPAGLELVTPGDVVEDRTEGEIRVTRRRTGVPIRIAGFNLGDYQHARIERSGFVVDVCANRALEKALQPKPAPAMLPAPSLNASRRRPDPLTEALGQTPPPSPRQRLQELAAEVASAMEFMRAKFGPPALPHLTVSPIPGTFGQGFSGLIYLSTLSYLKNLPRGAANSTTELFFADLLQAHEVAHQWWGNGVSAATYRDYWLMEALANYSALMYLEKSKGERSTDRLLDGYRDALITKNESGQTVDSTGPIVLGPRLENSLEPRAWRLITYGKGSWIIHMLRRRMGDERFFGLLAELMKRYDHKEMSTEDFRAAAAEFLPPKSQDPKLEAFFEQWVYGTGIPAFKLNWSVKGKGPALKLTGTLTQSDADEDFSTLVPVEIQLARGKTITRWIASASAPVSFSVPIPQAPLKVILDPRHAVLRR